MTGRIFVVVLMAAFLMTSTIPAMAGDKAGYEGKNALQCMYDWIAKCDKPCTTSSATTSPSSTATTAKTGCKTCGKVCCSTCQTGCNGYCCSKCGKK